MVSALAKGDYEDLTAEGLKPTLEDFDRLNQLALRLTDGAETTVANFPRIGWAGDVPFYQPTCAAFAWYLEFVERTDFNTATKDACWFYALNHARDLDAFTRTNPESIKRAVNSWLADLAVTREEIARACRFAAVGFEDAQAGKTDAQAEKERAKTDEDKREESLANLNENTTVTSAMTGIPPTELAVETPSRLAKMVEAVCANNPMGGGSFTKDRSRLTADYQLAFREIRKRLIEERKETNDGK